MKIVAITLTRNECDALETFLRHHAEVFDHLVLVIHRCSDNTEEIVQALVEEGLPITVRRDDAPDGEAKGVMRLSPEVTVHRQAAVMTHTLKQTLKQHSPDWVVPLDVDELVGSADGTSLRTILAARPTDRVTRVGWRTYVPTADDDPSCSCFARRIGWRRDREDERFFKAMLPAALAAEPRAVLMNGNHGLLDRRTGEAYPGELEPRLFLAHFPVRTADQIRAKILSGHLSLTAAALKGPMDGYQWRDNFDRCKDPRPIAPDELARMARTYGWAREDEPELVHDPLRTTATEPRLPMRPVDPWRQLAENAEHLAQQVARLAGRAVAPN